MTWTIDPSDFTKEVLKDHRTLTKKIAFEVMDGVISLSPVDTGRFRGNWQVTEDNAAATAVFDVDKSGAATVVKGASVINGVIKDGPIIFISNNVTYGLFLEMGSSKQAPMGMVMRTVNRVTEANK